MADESTPDGTADGTVQPDETLLGEAEQAIDEARRRLLDVPAEVVVTNHVMGLYELAAIHLSAPAPNLRAATLAIDAVANLVDGLGDRLGPDTSTLRDALANIRLAYVQVKKSAAAASAGAADDGEPAARGGDAPPQESAAAASAGAADDGEPAARGDDEPPQESSPRSAAGGEPAARGDDDAPAADDDTLGTQ